MSNDFNRNFMMGRLTADAELRYTRDELAVTNFRLAVNDRRDSPLFINVALFGKTAENLTEYLLRGTKVLVEGRLKIDKYEKDGQEVERAQIVANNVTLVESKKNE